MDLSKIAWFCFCMSALSLPSAMSAGAVDIQGRSSTQYVWYNDIVDGSKQADIAEYLRVSLDNIDRAGKFSVQGYGRAVYDVKNGGEVEDRLYYAFADYRKAFDSADIRLGRQFVNLSAGSALIDGINADFNTVGSLGITVMGGRSVIFGEDGALASHSYSAGASLYLAGVKNVDLDASYYRAYDYGDVARDILGASYRQFLLGWMKVYANARYDLTAEVFNEVLGGISLFPSLDLMLTAEYYESYPTFDATSIYSVFAVDKYQEYVAKADYTALAWLDLGLGYIHELFGEDETADVIEAGIRLRPSHSVTVGVFYDRRSGYGGDLDGVKTYVEYAKGLEYKIAAGADYDVYQRDDMTGEETAKKYWAGARYQIAKNMAASVRVENNVNINYSKDVKGRLTFDYDF